VIGESLIRSAQVLRLRQVRCIFVTKGCSKKEAVDVFCQTKTAAEHEAVVPQRNLSKLHDLINLRKAAIYRVPVGLFNSSTEQIVNNIALAEMTSCSVLRKPDKSPKPGRTFFSQAVLRRYNPQALMYLLRC